MVIIPKLSRALRHLRSESISSLVFYLIYNGNAKRIWFFLTYNKPMSMHSVNMIYKVQLK